MPLEYEVTVLRVDPQGRLYWRSTLAVNDAMLMLLRFARKNPKSICKIELRERKAEMEAISVESKQPAHGVDGGLQQEKMQSTAKLAVQVVPASR